MLFEVSDPQGYQWGHDNKICTIFSAPNYCYRCGNQAAIMNVKEDMTTDLYICSVFVYDELSIQFDPAPRDENFNQQSKVPDYFM